jgi:putative membrane protein
VRNLSAPEHASDFLAEDEATIMATEHSIDPATDMAMRRTGMSFQRTRMSADRTLMAEIRTGLSLISFGFTIFQIFKKLQDANLLAGVNAPRNFGIALVGLGIVMLVLGIVYHLQFMVGLRKTRAAMVAEGLIHGESHFPTSLTLITALVLLALGVAAIVQMLFVSG